MDMPDDILQRLYDLNDYEAFMELQEQWNQYRRTNMAYERNYDQQFGNLVLGNRSFGQQKSIPTPVEQMEQFNQSIREEIDMRMGKQKEALYQQDDKTSERVEHGAKDATEAKLEKKGEFRLEWESYFNEIADQDVALTKAKTDKDHSDKVDLELSQGKMLEMLDQFKLQNLPEAEREIKEAANDISKADVQQKDKTPDFDLDWGSSYEDRGDYEPQRDKDDYELDMD